jgi:YOP proteins translocation protein K (YscK)/Bacterial type III secretion protein (HrpB4)/Bacterial type III secretion apparatus protein (OrgA_MxiK)
MFKARVDQLVFDFNCQLVDYVDPSWLGKAERPLLQRLGESSDPQARAWASQWLLAHFGLGHSIDFDFTQPSKRLLLLDGATLRDLALLVGLSSLTHLLRTWVTRERLLRLRDALGVPLFEFYLAHVLTAKPVGRLLVAGEPAAAQLQGPQLLQHATRFGTALLLLACDAPASAALRRAQLKFEYAAGAATRARALPTQRQRAIVDFSVGCVIRLRHPSWHWLF